MGTEQTQNDNIRTGVFPCSVCGTEFGTRDELVAEITVPLYSFANNLRIPEWDIAVLECGECLGKLGIPERVYHRPYEPDVAKFSGCEELVVLAGRNAD